jgi:hypothetical protein
MFPFPIATPQGCNIQTFYGAGGQVAQNQRTWNKPVGVSHIYMMLIGGGGDGDNLNTGGGSGAVTVWYGAAQHVPNSLVVSPSRGNGNDTTVSARFSNSAAAPTALLTANAGVSGVAGTLRNPTGFAASGFYQSVAGQNGGLSGQTASSTTFLSGGASDGTLTANYGYTTGLSASYDGFFMLQPIIVGTGGLYQKRGGIGCGGGYINGLGGPGMVLIASW